MNDEERGRLFVQRENAEQRVAQLKRELFQHGDVLMQLAQQLRSKPENITFSNAPDGLGNIPMELLNAQSLPWEQLDVLRTVAQKIQDYRASMSELANIQSKLGSR